MTNTYYLTSNKKAFSLPMQHDQCPLSMYATGTQMKNCWCSTIHNITKIKFCYDAIQLCRTSTTFTTLHLPLSITMPNLGGRYCIRLILDGIAIPRSDSVLLAFCNATITFCLAFHTEPSSGMCVNYATCIFKNWILILLYNSRDHFVQPH